MSRMDGWMREWLNGWVSEWMNWWNLNDYGAMPLGDGAAKGGQITLGGSNHVILLGAEGRLIGVGEWINLTNNLQTNVHPLVSIACLIVLLDDDTVRMTMMRMLMNNHQHDGGDDRDDDDSGVDDDCDDDDEDGSCDADDADNDYDWFFQATTSRLTLRWRTRQRKLETVWSFIAKSLEILCPSTTGWRTTDQSEGSTQEDTWSNPSLGGPGEFSRWLSIQVKSRTVCWARSIVVWEILWLKICDWAFVWNVIFVVSTI